MNKTTYIAYVAGTGRCVKTFTCSGDEALAWMRRNEPFYRAWELDVA